MTISMPIRFDTAADAARYMLGGRAIVTLMSNKTNKHFTYKITVAKDNPNRYFVWVRTKKGYKFMLSLLYGGRKLQYSKKGMPRNYFLVQAFKWAWGHLVHNSMPKALIVYRYNICCRCGRRLTDPKSIKLGIGPECIKHVNV
jgi:hypothetical protein